MQSLLSSRACHWKDIHRICRPKEGRPLLHQNRRICAGQQKQIRRSGGVKRGGKCTFRIEHYHRAYSFLTLWIFGSSIVLGVDPTWISPILHHPARIFFLFLPCDSFSPLPPPPEKSFAQARALSTPHMPGALRGSCPLLLPIAAR